MAIIDNRAIYVAYYEGENIKTNKGNYTEPHIIYANVGEPVSYETIDDIGRIPEYDRVLVIDVGAKTEFIREDSILWIDTIPNDNKSNYDYVIARVGDEKGGIVKLYCNAIAPNTQFLYYCNDNENIYQVKVFYKDLIAIVPKNMYFPITAETKVWYMKPKDVTSEKALIRFLDRVEHVKTYSYIFEDYDVVD